jgi:hypothetical protein
VSIRSRRHARQAQGRGLQLAGVRHRGGCGSVRADDKAFAQDEVHRVLSRVRAAGINVIGNYIFGLPEDDLTTMEATLDLAVELNCEFANFYSAMAYPGSPLYELAVRQGLPLARTWSGYSQHARDCLPLPTRHLPARDVLRFRDEAFQRYYTAPRYLDMIENRFGTETIAHIADMTRHRLERDLLNGRLDVPPTLMPSASGALLTTSAADAEQSRFTARINPTALSR